MIAPNHSVQFIEGTVLLSSAGWTETPRIHRLDECLDILARRPTRQALAPRVSINNVVWPEGNQWLHHLLLGTELL